MSYVGDYRVGKTFYHRFTTVNASGVPTTLGNTPSAQYYVDGGTTAFTAGLTLTADFNSVTGLNSIQVIATSSATGLVTGVNVSVQLAAGTVSGVSLVGYPVIEYSLANRSALMPTTSDLTLFVDASGHVGAIVTAINTIAPARVTAQGIDVGAIVTAVSTIVPARVTAQGIDVGAIVTAVNTIAPARVTAQGIDIGAIVTAFNTIAPARVTAVSASGLASFFLTNSGTTYASATAGSVVKEIADNAGGASLSVTAIAAGVWDEDATAHQSAGSFGIAIGDPGADTTTLYAAVVTNASGASIAADITAISALVTALTAEVTATRAEVTATRAEVTATRAEVTAIRAKVTGLTFTSTNRVDANIQAVANVTVTGFGTTASTWGP